MPRPNASRPAHRATSSSHGGVLAPLQSSCTPSWDAHDKAVAFGRVQRVVIDGIRAEQTPQGQSLTQGAKGRGIGSGSKSQVQRAGAKARRIRCEEKTVWVKGKARRLFIL